MRGTWHATREQAAGARIPAGRRSALILEHGSLEVRYYAPKSSVDSQTPHDRDEVYIVASGRGFFVCGKARAAFGPNDMLFAPAGAVHRFEDFSDDFATWVVFYGPKGGERDNPFA
jgi:mannose-6-phosphate isomerase-like protein (cupin superfamily)